LAAIDGTTDLARQRRLLARPRLAALPFFTDAIKARAMAQYKSAFFAFPGEPAELTNPIAAAVELVKSSPFLSLQAWPQLQIFGAAIPDAVRGGIERASVLVCDITKPNLNVYYETGYSIGLGKSLAPVLNASFANATADIQKDGLFDIIGYKAYENSRGLAEILGDLPSTVLVDLYGNPLNLVERDSIAGAFIEAEWCAGLRSPPWPAHSPECCRLQDRR
jgi:hypothetical protein